MPTSPTPALACHLAASILRALSGIAFGQLNPDGAAAADLRAFSAVAVLPADIADLQDRLGDMPGTDLPGLIAKLPPDQETAERALKDLIAQAQALAAGPSSDLQLRSFL